MPDPTPAPEEAEALDEGQILLDLLFSHRMSWVQDFLRTNDLPVSGTKDELRERIEDLRAAETISIADLITLLESVEGWGNQHAYLYRAGDMLLDFFSNETQVKAKLKSRRCLDLFNRAVPLVLPAVPTLTTIQWSADRIRFVWIERRPWRKRLPEQDQKTETIEFDAFRPMMSRGMVSFSCDLTSGHAELLIQRLPSGENYAAEKTKFQNLLAQFFDVAQLTPVLVARAIKKFDDDQKVRKRACQFSTLLGSGVSYTSRSPQEDVYNDPSIKKAHAALGKNMAGRLGNFYSPMGDESEAHFKLYGKDQRVGIFGELTEGEVRDVLASIRKYCK
jgi:hypothetical protein